jgi:hypothetical protein
LPSLTGLAALPSGTEDDRRQIYSPIDPKETRERTETDTYKQLGRETDEFHIRAYYYGPIEVQQNALK